MTVVYVAWIIVHMAGTPPATLYDVRGPYETERACMERAGEMGRSIIKRNPYALIENVELGCNTREWEE